MKGKIIELDKYEDLESYVARIGGRYHGFIKHRTTPGIYILDLRPRKNYAKKHHTQLGFDFQTGYRE